MSGISEYIAKGLSYNKHDGVFLNFDQDTFSVNTFHRSIIGSIESYNTIKNKKFKGEKPLTPFGILFKNKTGGIILHLSLSDEKEQNEAITKLTNSEMDLFKDHSPTPLLKEDLLCLLECIKTL